MFDYPAAPHARKHGPSGYAQYPYYKPWLRDEFTFRCVYCLEREVWYPDRANSFHVEHILAKVSNPGSITAYPNLAYSCGRCNTFKGIDPLLNPTTDSFGDHLKVNDDGSVIGLTNEGKVLIK